MVSDGVTLEAGCTAPSATVVFLVFVLCSMILEKAFAKEAPFSPSRNFAGTARC